MRNLGRFALLLVLCGVLTTLLQTWVGNFTVYNAGREPTRITLHNAILHNELPPGVDSWRQLGANGTNVRVFAVYLAEGLHRASGIPLLRVHRTLDTVSLFVSFVLLFAFLRQWFDEKYALIGLLYFALMTMLTYQFFYFHPWDRIGMVFWLLSLFLIQRQRALLLGLTLIVAMTNRYNVVLMPVLYAAYTMGRVSRLRWGLTTAALSIATVGTYLALVRLFPGGFAAEPLVQLIPRTVAQNWQVLKDLGFAHPPLLAFVLPAALAIPRLFSMERFMWTSAGFGFALLGAHVLLVVFHEVRSEIPILVLLLPAALFNLRALLEPPAAEPTPET